MAEDNSSLHIDTDWKKQAQEEKRKLSEQEQQKKAADQTAAAKPPASAGGTGPSPAGGARGGREMPPASFPTLVQSLLTQVLFYLGDLAPRGAEPQINLDLAKHNIDLLGVIEEKTRGNLNANEDRLMQDILFDLRMKYVEAVKKR